MTSSHAAPKSQQWFLLSILVFVLMAAPAMAERVWTPWPCQDGSLVLAEKEGALALSFPYIPFLEEDPAWTPALPRLYEQPAEPVTPLPGLAGTLQLGVETPEGTFHPFTGEDLSLDARSPYSASFSITRQDAKGTLAWAAPLDERGFVFEYTNSQPAEVTLRFALQGFEGKTPWATPGRKMKRDWGEPSWSWDETTRCLLQAYSQPIDATHSPTTVLWFGEISSAWKAKEIHYEKTGAAQISIRVKIPASESIRFGFLQGDNTFSVERRLEPLRKNHADLATLERAWTDWLSSSKTRIEEKLHLSLAQLSPEDQRFLAENLLEARLMFLSNGGVLSEPMTPSSYPISVRGQAIAVRHWRELGLEFPRIRRWRDLAHFNQMTQRSVDIPLFTDGQIHEVLAQGKMIVAAPDPGNPPDQASFDSLLGYVIGGGHLTLVDGVNGFSGREGWWKEAGAADPAEYAIKTLGVRIDPKSRRVLDEEGLAPGANTFALGAIPIGRASAPADGKATFKTPKPGGYLMVYPGSSEDTNGLRIRGCRLGERSFRPFTTEEDKWLAASYGTRPARDRFGETEGCALVGQGFVAYSLPASTTVACELDLSGNWAAAWTADPPRTEVTLRKKAFQNWFAKDLMTVPISRLAHPVVYNATFTARVFDVSGTEDSPVLYHKVGRGSLIWIGLPREFLTLGSDTGTDRQNGLRKDPTYDLLRLALSLHDPKQGGAERASRTPLAGWGEGWSQGEAGDPRVEMAYFAWSPFALLGVTGTNLSNWFQDAFLDAIRLPETEAETLPNLSLYASRAADGREVVDLSTNAFVYALTQGFSRAAASLGRTWLVDWNNRQGKHIAASLAAILDTTGETPTCGRYLLNGVPGAAAPVESLLPGAAWAVSEISPSDFPGGAEAQTRLANALAANKQVLEDPRALAALATRDTSHQVELVERLLALKDKSDLALIGQGGKPFDISTAIPSVQALCLAKGKPQ